MLNAYDVADFFLSPFEEEDGEQISNLKLQKLLYYAQGYALAILNRPLFAENIEHWQHGPVVPCIYRTYKKYGGSPLPAAHIEPDKYADEELVVLNRVRKEQGCYTAWALRNKTHQEAPWIQTRQGEIIGITLLREYFRHSLPPTDYNFDLEKLKTAVDGSFVSIPQFDTVDDLEKWLER